MPRKPEDQSEEKPKKRRRATKEKKPRKPKKLKKPNLNENITSLLKGRTTIDLFTLLKL
jgi:hypothetical protein